MGFAGYVSICVQLYCGGFHSLSLHVSVYMALQVCRQTTKKEQADKQTHKETTKIMKENSTGTKQKWKRAECDHVEKKAKKQRSRILQEYEN
jgi:hypothetical protein